MRTDNKGLRELTEKQLSYARARISGLGVRSSAKATGYTKQDANSLEKAPHVRAFIDRETLSDREHKRRLLKRIMDNPETRSADILKAIELDSKLEGEFGRRSEQATSQAARQQSGSLERSRELNALKQATQRKLGMLPEAGGGGQDAT